mgnify:CR=1 FL=1
MTYILKNKNLELHIDDPLKHYDFPRFDWTGKLTLLKYKGVLVSGNEKIKANEIEQFGRGFYNEFGINTPIGFDEIAIDDWFHKIGVGLLRKDKHHYFFLNNYDTDPAIFNVKAKDNSIVMSCKGQFKNGKPIGKFTYFYKSSKVKAVIKHVENSTRSEAYYFHETRFILVIHIGLNNNIFEIISSRFRMPCV